ncbi:membrane hypothetical protein [Gammaproteobacteria bacterium]
MTTNRSRLVLNSPILLIELFTLLLLGYISYGEVNFQYPRFVLGKMEAQAETIKTSLDPYLQAAIPIDQFSGFNTQSHALFDSDSDIEVVRVVTQDNEVVFEQLATAAVKLTFKPLTEGIPAGGRVRFGQSDVSYQVVMALEGKFGSAGRIEIETSKQAVKRVVDESFLQVAYRSIILFVVFSVFILLFDRLTDNHPTLAKWQPQVFKGAYFVSFAVIVAIIVFLVFGIYDSGARAKAKALADSMAQRISEVQELNLDLQDISGINEIFRDYQSRHSDISTLALTKDDQQVLFHTQAGEIGKPYHPPSDSYEYSVDLDPHDGKKLHLAVAIPMEIVRAAILEQANQFVVLLIACGLMSWVFLDASGVLLGKIRSNIRPVSSVDPVLDGFKLIKPAYFLIVFTSALPVSFLPHLTKEMAVVTGVNYATATLPFTIYYFVFAAVLIPAGHYAANHCLKRMMSLGFITELVGLIFIALGDNYWMLTIGRIFSGFGQGVFLIGLNSYTLSITPKDKRTMGNTVKVNGRNAALISGTSIGALLYTYMSYQSLFLVASAISLIGMLYLVRLVPAVDEICSLAGMENFGSSTARSGPQSRMLDDLFYVMRDPEFLRTLGLVGVIGKIAIAGVIMFATPLILAERGMPSDEIGLMLMLFYIASIIVTRYASVLVDHLGASRGALFLSAVVGGLGMLFMGITGINEWNHPDAYFGITLLAELAVRFNHWLSNIDSQHATSFLLISGIILAGISNGLMSAPIMTHIDKTPVAHSHGNKAVAAIYLFLERGGHMMGPMVISVLLAFTYNTPLGIAIFGIVTICLGSIFLVTARVE